LEIVPFLERTTAALSGGEKQRVALGRALLAGPRLLLLDEPLAGLDAPLRERLLPYLARVRDEFAVPMLYVTHSPDEVMALCDDVLVLASGRVDARGRPSELFQATPHPRYERRL
jgi:molybdate transport system ATP-binding protein